MFFCKCQILMFVQAVRVLLLLLFVHRRQVSLVRGEGRPRTDGGTAVAFYMMQGDSLFLTSMEIGANRMMIFDRRTSLPRVGAISFCSNLPFWLSKRSA